MRFEGEREDRHIFISFVLCWMVDDLKRVHFLFSFVSFLLFSSQPQQTGRDAKTLMSLRVMERLRSKDI